VVVSIAKVSEINAEINSFSGDISIPNSWFFLHEYKLVNTSDKKRKTRKKLLKLSLK
jgi:hypothetical protein